MICRAECDRKSYARGFCRSHYSRLGRGRRGRKLMKPLRTYGHTHVIVPCKDNQCGKSATRRGFCENHWTRRRAQKIRLMVLASVGAWCRDCGADDLSVSSYTFHHEEPKNGRKTVGERVSDGNLNEALKEASKCILLCENCHRAGHNPQTGRIVNYG